MFVSREFMFSGSRILFNAQSCRFMTIRSGSVHAGGYKTVLRSHIENYLRNRGVPISRVGSAGLPRVESKEDGAQCMNSNVHTVATRGPAAQQELVRDSSLERVWTVPNVMTMTRIALSPWLAYEIMRGNNEVAFAVFTFGASLDYFDGWVARRFNQKSLLGSYLDPVADKVLVACTFLPLTLTGAIPPVLAGIVLLRDVALVGASFYARHLTRIKGESFFSVSSVSNVSVEPTLLSKVNTALQMGLVTSTLAGLAINIPMLAVGSVFMDSVSIATGLTTIWSFIDYYRLSGTRLKQLQEQKRIAEKYL